MASGGGGDQDITTTTNPWLGQQPYLARQFSRADTLYNRGGPQYYPGQNYVPLSPQTKTALGMQWDRARQGNPVMDDAQKMVRNTLQGDYLTPESNPYLQQYYQQATEQAIPQMNSIFSMSGRTGADAQSQGLADTYGAIGRDIYGGAYENERNRQMQAVPLGLSIAQNDYQDIAAARDVGASYEKQRGNELMARMERYNFNQNRPYDNLSRYAQMVGGGYGSQSTQNQPSYGNPLGGAVGGAMASMSMGGGPIPGALLGYYLGL